MKLEEVVNTGKKIRRSSWHKESYIKLDNDGSYRSQNYALATITINDAISDDWELVKDIEEILNYDASDFEKMDIHHADTWNLMFKERFAFIKDEFIAIQKEINLLKQKIEESDNES